jgi:hypothetical protein
MSGIHVTGLVSCTRILNLSVSSAAPFMPSIWRAAELLASFFSAGALFAALTDVAEPAGAGDGEREMAGVVSRGFLPLPARR